MLLLTLTTLIAGVLARPSFIAVPADQIAFLDLSSLRHVRVPRQTHTPPPAPVPLFQDVYEPIPVQEFQPNDGHGHQQRTVFSQGLPYQGNHLAPHLTPPPVPQQHVTQTEPAHVVEVTEPHNMRVAADRGERPPDFGEYVDFGAHSGDNGAFGWYADYPVNDHEAPHGAPFRK